MLSRRLESGLSTDELRTILCRVTMRNTRFTWVRGQEMGSVSAPTLPLQGPKVPTAWVCYLLSLL